MFLKEHSQTQHSQSLADCLPDGKYWESRNINDSNFKKFLLGFSNELIRIEQKINELVREVDLTTTENLISEWERAFGIPDDCFKNTTSLSLAERIKQVAIKIKMDGVSTNADFVNLASELGVNVVIKSGIDEGTFPYTFPILLFSSVKVARFTIVIEMSTADGGESFPYTFPLTFTESVLTILKCIFEKIKPANCDVLYKFV